MQPHGAAPLINYGDIFWVAADESIGAISGSPHPHLVVQGDAFNHSRIATVVVCSLSSNLKRAAEPGVILLDPGEGGLERQSVVIASQVSSISKDRLGDRIGSLSSQRVNQVIAALRFLQTSHFRGR
jgi:mRNA interferase MazF